MIFSPSQNVFFWLSLRWAAASRAQGPTRLPLINVSFRFLLAAQCPRCCELSSASLEGEVVGEGLQSVLSSHLALRIAFTSVGRCSSEHTAAVAFPFRLFSFLGIRGLGISGDGPLPGTECLESSAEDIHPEKVGACWPTLLGATSIQGHISPLTFGAVSFSSLSGA